MRPTDYETIAQALGISASEARELETEHRHWREFLTLKEETSQSFKAIFVHR
jgi:hypothetical protein